MPFLERRQPACVRTQRLREVGELGEIPAPRRDPQRAQMSERAAEEAVERGERVRSLIRRLNRVERPCRPLTPSSASDSTNDVYGPKALPAVAALDTSRRSASVRFGARRRRDRLALVLAVGPGRTDRVRHHSRGDHDEEHSDHERTGDAGPSAPAGARLVHSSRFGSRGSALVAALLRFVHLRLAARLFGFGFLRGDVAVGRRPWPAGPRLRASIVLAGERARRLP